MHPLFRSVTRLLLLVMLATVFAPSFGWQVAQGMAAHDVSPAAHDAAHAHDHDHGASAPQAAEHDACAEGGHHSCPGHFFGHLIGGTADAFLPAIAGAGAAVLIGRQTRFSSRVPEGLERPPRASAA